MIFHLVCLACVTLVIAYDVPNLDKGKSIFSLIYRSFFSHLMPNNQAFVDSLYSADTRVIVLVIRVIVHLFYVFLSADYLDIILLNIGVYRMSIRRTDLGLFGITHLMSVFILYPIFITGRHIMHAGGIARPFWMREGTGVGL